MKLTVDFIAKTHEEFNEKYFGGKLSTPMFGIMNGKTILGYFRYKSACPRNTSYYWIKISDYYVRSDKQYQQTILHEMIHQYIAENGLVDTRSHGVLFQKEASRLNKFGWTIARTDSVEGCDLAEKNKKIYNVCVYKSAKSGRYFSFVMSKGTVSRFKKHINRYNEFYGGAHFFESDDYKRFSKYTECRSRIHGFYISEDEYNNFVSIAA